MLYYEDMTGEAGGRFPGQRIARCIQCGYSICEDDEAGIISANGGAIHRDCWEEYAAENPDEFLKAI